MEERRGHYERPARARNPNPGSHAMDRLRSLAAVGFLIFAISVKESLKRFNSRERHAAWQTKKPRLAGGNEPGFGVLLRGAAGKSILSSALLLLHTSPSRKFSGVLRR